MKKKYIYMLVLVFVLLVGCGAKDNKDAAKIVEEKAISVKIQEVKTGYISKDYKYSSTFLPEEKVMVIPEVQGEVKEVYFDIGDEVKKDDVLFKISKEDINKQIENLDNQLKSVDLTIDLQKTALESSKGSQYNQQLNQVEQQYKMSEIAYNDAKTNLEDMTKLYEKGAITKQQYDQVNLGLNKAKISRDSAKKAYDLFINELSKESINVSENQYNQAVVKKEQLLLGYNTAKETLDDTEVKAPIDGLISQRNVEPNQFISGQSVPFIIVNMDNLIVEIGVSEKLVRKIEVADKVKIKIADEGILEGEITAISPAADERTMSYLTKIKVTNKDYKIKPGMFLDVIFETDKIKDALLIPIEAVINYEDENYVFVLNEENKAQKVLVTLGINNGKDIQILSGLKKEDKVIVEGQNFVEDDSKIKIVE